MVGFYDEKWEGSYEVHNENTYFGLRVGNLEAEHDRTTTGEPSDFTVGRYSSG